MSADIEFINRSRITIGEVWRMRGSHSEIGVGPVLDWRTISIDEWFDDETDLEVIRQNLFNWGESFGRQLSPDVCPVHVAAGIGARVSSRFNDQQRLQLTLDTMCGINQGNEELQQMVSFYQPLGDEIDAHAMAVSPLHAADALQRTDVGLQRLGLEIMFSDAAVPSNRNLLMLDSQIQAWNQFDLPLTIILNFPGWDCLGNAAKNNTAKNNTAKNNTAKNNTAKNNTDEDLSSQRLLQEADNLLALLDSKTIVDRVCFAPTSVVGLDVVKDENRVCFADLVSRIVARRNETMQSV